MPYLYLILDSLLLSWVFWLIIIILPLIAYGVVTRLAIKGEDEAWPAFLLALVGGALLYRYPTLRVTDWHTWLYLVLGYAAAGFAVALYKWLAVLMAFRQYPVKVDIGCAKADQQLRFPQNNEAAHLAGAAHTLKRNYRYDKCLVETNDDDTITIYPDWRKYPIGTWFSYWPFFILAIPFDWLTRLGERITTWLRQFWDGIARHFSVRG